MWKLKFVSLKCKYSGARWSRCSYTPFVKATLINCRTYCAFHSPFSESTSSQLVDDQMLRNSVYPSKQA